MANASKKHGMGAGTVIGHQSTGTADPATLDEDDLAGHIAKADRLNAHDRGDRHQHQRTTLPGSQDLRNQPDQNDPIVQALTNGDDEEARRG